MAEETKTEEKSSDTRAEDSKLQKENKILKARVKELEESLTREQQARILDKEKIDDLQARVSVDGSLLKDGLWYELDGSIETAKELTDRIRKSFVAQDAFVGVLKKL